MAGESRKGTAVERVWVSRPGGAWDGGGRVSERVIHHSVTYACTRECPEIIERERWNRFSLVMLATEILFVSRASRKRPRKSRRIEKWKLPRYLHFENVNAFIRLNYCGIWECIIFWRWCMNVLFSRTNLYVYRECIRNISSYFWTEYDFSRTMINSG